MNRPFDVFVIILSQAAAYFKRDAAQIHGKRMKAKSMNER